MTTKAQETKRDELLKIAESKRYKRGWVWHRLAEEYGKEIASELLPREKKQRPFSHMSEDEQVAVHTAIERERLEKSYVCPDCGGWMEVERDNTYCERCEG